LGKEAYYKELKNLDIRALYKSIADAVHGSQTCWPADGPEVGDKASYAGLFGRLAWHCSGTYRAATPGFPSAGGCEGGRQRFWPENAWRDNSNLDKARALLTPIKERFGDQVSWGDLFTFAGTVAIKASGGPAEKFCFGRVDDADGSKSVELSVEGTNACKDCKSDVECPDTFRWPEQDEEDHARCNFTQPGRKQASHSVGLIYVYPEGPQLKKSDPEYNPNWVHQRSRKLSALEVRDTFKVRMGWTDRETVAIIGGGHTLGRTHGACDLSGGKGLVESCQGAECNQAGYAGVGPHFEAEPGSGRGPTDGTCGSGADAGRGPNTVTSGFDGPWTSTPSQWNYEYFDSSLNEEWEPVKSAFGNDQWWTVDRTGRSAVTRRLTADLSLVTDPTYKAIAMEYAMDHAKFDKEFADAWFKLVHRSGAHPGVNDLEKDAGVCTHFEFLKACTDDPSLAGVAAADISSKGYAANADGVSSWCTAVMGNPVDCSGKPPQWLDGCQKTCGKC